MSEAETHIIPPVTPGDEAWSHEVENVFYDSEYRFFLCECCGSEEYTTAPFTARIHLQMAAYAIQWHRANDIKNAAYLVRVGRS